MKHFLLFKFELDYSAGGWNDLEGKFYSLQEVAVYHEENPLKARQVRQVVDIMRGCEVAEWVG